jgi:hypothetical protein
MTGLPYQQTLSDLQAKLDEAIADCNRYARPAHAVRNCPSDLQNEDQAWRKRRSLDYQIAELKKELQIGVDKCLTLDK